MKSIYQDKTFSDFWNNRVGNDGEDLKRYVLDPLMLKTVGSLSSKAVLELGCGNGYMATKFLQGNVSKAIMMDISAENLKHTKEKVTDPKVEFLEHDATIKWPLKNEEIDVIYSNMMLIEVQDIETPIKEAYRVLKKAGLFIFSIMHPGFLLYFYAQQQAGLNSGKFKNLKGYFNKDSIKYVMGSVSVTKSAIKKEYSQDFEIEQNQKNIADYINTCINAGFTVKQMFEPELTPELLKYNPGFQKYIDIPIALILFCQK